MLINFFTISDNGSAVVELESHTERLTVEPVKYFKNCSVVSTHLALTLLSIRCAFGSGKTQLRLDFHSNEHA